MEGKRGRHSSPQRSTKRVFTYIVPQPPPDTALPPCAMFTHKSRGSYDTTNMRIPISFLRSFSPRDYVYIRLKPPRCGLPPSEPCKVDIVAYEHHFIFGDGWPELLNTLNASPGDEFLFEVGSPDTILLSMFDADGCRRYPDFKLSGRRP